MHDIVKGDHRKGIRAYYFPRERREEKQKTHAAGGRGDRLLLGPMRRRKIDSGLRRLVEGTPVPPDCQFVA